MKLFVLIAILLWAVSASLSSKLIRPTNAHQIYEDRFIIFLQPENSIDALYDHLGSHFVDETRGKVFTTYEGFETFKGYAAQISDPTLLKELADDSRVRFIEHDQEMRATDACKVQTDAVWGLDRVSERDLLLNGKYFYDHAAGAGVASIVIDTGIYLAHQDFENRAVFGANYAGGVNDDCNGHGTHVAGTVGGKAYGLAKSTTLYSVKVLNCQGSGSNSGVISGIEWARQMKSTKKVANMSLGGGKSTALNTAVADAVKSGMVFVVAAGNENANACNYSPASESSAITVGATAVDNKNSKQEDARSTFSNYGNCVDILAPGTAITSDWIGNPTAILTISGTSMASPHVAGAAALYWSENPTATSSDVKSALLKSATPNKVDLICGSNAACKTTPNALLYSKC